MDRDKVIKGLECCVKESEGYEEQCGECPYGAKGGGCIDRLLADTITMLKEQEKKRITLHKKHVIAWNRNDEFSMRKLYEAICETLLDEGELFIARTDDHEKVDFVFYVTEGDEAK